MRPVSSLLCVERQSIPHVPLSSAMLGRFALLSVRELPKMNAPD
jgi:hypothetical protein